MFYKTAPKLPKFLQGKMSLQKILNVIHFEISFATKRRQTIVDLPYYNLITQLKEVVNSRKEGTRRKCEYKTLNEKLVESLTDMSS